MTSDDFISRTNSLREFTLVDLYHALEAVRSAMAELEELEAEHDWFVSDSLAHLRSTEELLVTKINTEKNN